MKCLVLAPVSALFLVACAASPEQKVSDAASPPCELVYKVGSHLPTRDCSAPPSEAERQRTIDALRDATKVGAKPAGGGG
ncbi:MAG: hypothetical protein ABI460_07685 [Caldimonas sp.]